MAEIEGHRKDNYQVAVKLFLEDGEKLFVFKDRFGDWDIPGGRLRRNEFATPFQDVIYRKVREEIGPDVQYTVETLPSVIMRHERAEVSRTNPRVHILGLGYRATFLGGTIALSTQHMEMLWVDRSTYQPDEHFIGGWLEGMREYLKRYCQR